MNTIRLIKRSEIDLEKWDELVNRSTGSLPYSLSWYLDAVAENWDALVMNGYEAVMPLTWFRKMGVKCLYQPYYCQQSAIFSRKPPANETVEEFIRLATKKFSYIDINLSVLPEPVAEEFSFRKKTNLLIDLDKNYGQLSEIYDTNHRRNIRKAEKSGFRFDEETTLKSFIDFYLENLDRKKEDFKKKHEKVFRVLTNELVERNKGKIFSVINKEGRIMAVAMMISHQKRIINIVNCSSNEGKKAGSSHFLFDRIIQKYAGEDKILDFEGSSVPGIARFYRGFGAWEEIFFNYRRHVFQL